MGKLVYEGDRFGYDYDLKVRRGKAWTTFAQTVGILHYTVGAKLGYDGMNRKGNMRNGMFADNSYGKSKTAEFISGGGKFNGTFNLGKGSTFSLGLGYEHRAPQATTAFVSPEMNNDFVSNLKNERVFSSEASYQYVGTWLHANLSAYYSHLTNVTEWQNYYFDDINSFSYVSMTNIKKNYYGVEFGLDFKLTSFLNFKTLGTWSDAKYINNANVRYMNSTKATYTDDIVYNKGMRESGTPLSAYSAILSFHQGGWFIDINGNYYDRIFLSYAPSRRYGQTLVTAHDVDNDGNYVVPGQAKGQRRFHARRLHRKEHLSEARQPVDKSHGHQHSEQPEDCQRRIRAEPFRLHHQERRNPLRPCVQVLTQCQEVLCQRHQRHAEHRI